MPTLGASGKSVDVCAWGFVVGRVLRTASGLEFEASKSWAGRGFDLDPLAGLIVDANSDGIPTWLTDSLPDEFGRRLIAQGLRHAGIIDPAQEFADLAQELCWIGDRAIGALEFGPGSRRGVGGCKTPVDVAGLVGAANAWLFGVDKQHPCLDLLIELGSVAGGQRAKAVVAVDPGSEVLYPQSCADKDARLEQWILKLDGVAPAPKGDKHEPGAGLGWGRVEYAYSLMARAAGIKMSPCRLVEENGRAHFMTKRFDRMGGAKIHQVSLCALAGMDYTLIGRHSYDGLFDVIERLDLGESARRQAFRQMAFNVLAQNNDDHTKNFGFQLSENRTSSMAPGYDITYAYHPDSYWVSQHLMSVNGKFKNIGMDDIAGVGQDWVVEGFEQIIDEVAAAVERWPQFARRAGVEQGRLEQINDSIATIC